MCLVLSASVRHFDVALPWKFRNHDDFAVTVRYRSLLLLLLLSVSVFLKDTRKLGSLTPPTPSVKFF